MTATIMHGSYNPPCPRSYGNLYPGRVLTMDPQENLRSDLYFAESVGYQGGTVSNTNIDVQDVGEYWAHGDNYATGNAYYIDKNTNTSRYYSVSPFVFPDVLPYAELHTHDQSLYKDSTCVPPHIYNPPISDGPGSGHTQSNDPPTTEPLYIPIKACIQRILPMTLNQNNVKITK